MKYEIKNAKNGSLVPIVDGVHLHSTYNPQKEAETLVEKLRPQIAKSNKILILGAGFGYHIKAIHDMAKSYHDKFTIYVIDPNIELMTEAIRHNLIPQENVFIMARKNAESLYQNIVLVSFLTERPVVYMHQASFTVYKSFFETFLTYKANNHLSHCSKILTDQETIKYLDQFEQSYNFKDLITVFEKDTGNISGMDHLLLAINEINQRNNFQKNNTEQA